MTAALNPRFVAYCRSVGIAPTVEALRARDGNWVEFMCWIGARLLEWKRARGLARPPVSPAEDDDFTAFCDCFVDAAHEAAEASAS